MKTFYMQSLACSLAENCDNKFFIMVTDYDICCINNSNYDIYYSRNTLNDNNFNIISVNKDFIEISNDINLQSSSKLCLKRYYIGTYQLEQEVDILYSVHKCMIEFLKSKNN